MTSRHDMVSRNHHQFLPYLPNPSEQNSRHGLSQSPPTLLGSYYKSVQQELNNMTVVRRKNWHRSLSSGSPHPYSADRGHHYSFDNAQPSIRTVEAAANAKIFLETFYNNLYTRSDERDGRRMELETWLNATRLSVHTRAQHRKAWFAKESQYLRKTRKLKTRSRAMTLYQRDLEPGGYHILRVLGKGSFGTVCLVEERGETSSFHNSRLYLERSANETRALSEVNVSSMQRRPWSGKRPYSAEYPRPCYDRPPVYAMKVIRKKPMLENSQEGHIRAERDFLAASACSPWVVNLFASFQDSVNLYLIMEYMIGGDFLTLLIKEDILSERRTRFYIAEMIMCIEAAHNLGWIHRDVKPDNFLISASGHLKIADFGLAFDGHWSHDQNYYHAQRYSLVKKFELAVTSDETDVAAVKASDEAIEKAIEEAVVKGEKPPAFESYLAPRETDAIRLYDPSSAETFSNDEQILQWRDRTGRRALARSLVGTSQYMAPEIILGQDYDGRCDYWSIGIIMYECLFGHTPFYGRDRDATKQRIVDHERYLSLPPKSSKTRTYKNVSVFALELIQLLLAKREHRLSSSSYRRNDASAHHHQNTASLRNFVYVNDARDIKKHPFFYSIDWNELHKQPSKYIPKVDDPADTRHFDTEELQTQVNLFPVEDLDTEDMHLEDEILGLCSRFDHLDGPSAQVPVTGQQKAAKPEVVVAEPKSRPRDRILRDEMWNRDALKLRKKNAFLGYTFRRPPEARPFIRAQPCLEA